MQNIASAFCDETKDCGRFKPPYYATPHPWGSDTVATPSRSSGADAPALRAILYRPHSWAHIYEQREFFILRPQGAIFITSISEFFTAARAALHAATAALHLSDKSR